LDTSCAISQTAAVAHTWLTFDSLVTVQDNAAAAARSWIGQHDAVAATTFSSEMQRLHASAAVLALAMLSGVRTCSGGGGIGSVVGNGG
jgi:hypothetical protein